MRRGGARAGPRGAAASGPIERKKATSTTPTTTMRVASVSLLVVTCALAVPTFMAAVSPLVKPNIVCVRAPAPSTQAEAEAA